MTKIISDVFEDEGIERPVSRPVSDVFKDEGIARPTEDITPEVAYLKDEEILSNPLKMAGLRAYMKDRKGVEWETKPDQEVLDTFRGHMRWAGTNEIWTIGEARYIHNATEEQKANAATAYSIYDELAPFWKEHAISGAWDYTKSILASPSTYLGGVIGGIAGKGVASVAKPFLMKTAIGALHKGGIEAAKKVLVAGAKQKAMTAIVGATVTDSGLAVLQDNMYQDIMKDVGLQEEHNYVSTALSALGGLAGGAIATIPVVRKGSVGFGSRTIREARKARIATAKSRAAPRIKKSLEKLVKSIQDPIPTPSGIDWESTVAAGVQRNPTINDLTNNISWFFDIDDPDSIVRIIVDSGAPLRLGQEDRFTEQIIDFVKGLPSEELDEINKMMEPVLGLKLGELVDIVAVGESRGGSILQRAQRAKEYAKKFADISIAVARVNKNITDAAEAAAKAPLVKGSPQHAKYLASLWRRMLVSHWGTTALNVQGWGVAYYADTMAELVHGGMLGSAGAIGKTLNREWAPQALSESKALIQNQAFKLRTLLDPYGSREAFDALVRLASKKVQDAIRAESFGGIAQQSPDELFNMHSGSKITSSATKGAEWTADKAAAISLIKAQDVFTKTFSGLAELDKQSRLAYNKGLRELIQDGEYYKITDEMWDATTERLLQDTFSMDYTKGDNYFGLNSMANLVEKASEAPYIGFLFPFGRFMNNNLAFFLQHSPLALVPVAAKLSKRGAKGLLDPDIGNDLAKAMVGTTALATLINYSRDLSERGYQWNEVVDERGEVIDRENAAPLALFRVLARIGDHLVDRESVPPELITEFVDQLGISQWAKELSGDTPLGAITNYLITEKNPEAQEGFWSIVASASKAFGNQVLSGFTRPLDPANRVVGMLTETDAAIDRRMAQPGMEEFKIGMMRYTDNMFDAVLGEQGETLRQATRPEGNIYDPNPISSLEGRKVVHAKNYTDRLLGMVDMPAYLFDQRTGIPEADRFINEKIAPLLNVRSKGLLEDPVFKQASLAIKRDMVKMLLEQARADIRSSLQTGYIGNRENQLEDQRRIWLAQPKAIRDEARKDLNIGTPDRQLNERELLLLRDYTKTLRDFYKIHTD